ncbi:hypothetical protein H7F15_09045 [Pontibacter sp. Tf4]|uniref:hypothetical protein n=1 Tax=Pontibacter sp. Tf4 TaxID=2761620 RepID=UPI0016248AC1|nr:hypothetical protein [Pontibacter sp. Tf4]MBB6611181.1 hypothetical protein [Pontibacter sp. Tf4]
MKTRFLFPHRYKLLGWVLLVPSLIVGFLAIMADNPLFELNTTVFALYDGGIFESAKAFKLVENNIFDELIAVTAIVGGLLAAFSREKDEDEYISQIRLESLLWATYINYGFLLFSVLFIYGLAFYQVLLLNMLTLLIIFLIRFNFILYRTSKAAIA